MSEVVWEGAVALADHLVLIDSVDSHPDNPRRGNIPMIANSLLSFGQLRPVLVQEETRWVVAGNHTRLAAEKLGWSHIAAIVEPMTEQKARAYLLADNRSSDVGSYDTKALYELLKPMESTPLLAMTGYDEQILARLAEVVGRDKVADGESHVARPSEIKEALTAVLASEKMADLRRWVAMLRREWSIDDPSDVIYEAVKREAARL